MKAINFFASRPKGELRYVDFLLGHGSGLIFPSYGMQNAISQDMR